RKGERRAATFILSCPQAPAMALDDGPTDGEANAHAGLLGRVERLEGVQAETDARISDRQKDQLARAKLRLDTEVSGTVVNVLHRIEGISQQVQITMATCPPRSRGSRRALLVLDTGVRPRSTVSARLHRSK